MQANARIIKYYRSKSIAESIIESIDEAVKLANDDLNEFLEKLGRSSPLLPVRLVHLFTVHSRVP